jgi:hypothetical protein
MDNPLTEPEQFQAWKEHRLTQAFLQYLKDRCLQLAMEWAQGVVPSAQMQPQQSQAETLGDLAALECSDVRAFYDIKEEPEVAG